jgi:hypothetical protein
MQNRYTPQLIGKKTLVLRSHSINRQIPRNVGFPTDRPSFAPKRFHVHPTI